MHILNIVLICVSWLLVIAVFLPQVKSDNWIFRILEYPRLQKFIICLSIFIALLFFANTSNIFQLISLISLGLGVLYLIKKIFPYSILAPKQMVSLQSSDVNNQLKLYTANVYQYNRSYTNILAQIKKCKPDVILLVETDKLWEDAMDYLIKEYPHCLKEPLDNTYGMLFYSKFEMVEGRVNYLIKDDVPSIEAKLKLPSGQLIKVWGLHPKPPIPSEDPQTTAKDKEIMTVAFEVKNEKLPVVVMGDLNDVAWSYVTELFTKSSGLLDPRRGRGFFSTFSANHWYMRFPLDYVFCSAHFGLVKMKRMPHNGSDHFPMFSHFEYHEDLFHKQHKPHADADEKEDATEKVHEQVLKNSK